MFGEVFGSGVRVRTASGRGEGSDVNAAPPSGAGAAVARPPIRRARRRDEGQADAGPHRRVAA